MNNTTNNNINIELVEKMLDRRDSQDPHYLADFIELAYEPEFIDAVWAGLGDGSFELPYEHEFAFYLLRG